MTFQINISLFHQLMNPGNSSSTVVPSPISCFTIASEFICKDNGQF